MLKAVFFDAAGTIFEARQPVGRSYARLAREFGVDTSEEAVSAAFRRVFHAAPPLAFGAGHPPAELRRLERQWWWARVADTFAGLGEFSDFDAYFDALFAFFADPAHWRADDEAPVRALSGWRGELFGRDALDLKHGRLALTAAGKRIKLVRLDGAAAAAAQ